MVKPTSIRIVLSITLSRAWQIRQLDINNAFLNGHIEEDIYMTQPQGYVVGDGSLVCKLTKALYGLKQAPRAWFQRLSTALVSLGFNPTK